MGLLLFQVDRSEPRVQTGPMIIDLTRPWESPLIFAEFLVHLDCPIQPLSLYSGALVFGLVQEGRRR